MDDSRKPLLNKPEDEEHPRDISAWSTPGYCSINALEPQPCYRPPSYDSLSTTSVPKIQCPDEEVVEELQVYKSYKRRWYVLLVYSLIAATQSGIWNMYGPIANTVEPVFNWSDSTIELLSNWGPISYLVSGILMSWMLDVKGLRFSCIVAALLVAMGATIKCITFQLPTVTWLTHVGQFLNGLGGPVGMTAPPFLSAIWFPVNERTTSTAISTVLNSFGVAVSFIFGPFLVPDLSNSTAGNVSHGFNYNITYLFEQHIPLENLSTAISTSDAIKGIALYTYIGAGWSVALFILIVVYFPSKPPFPPCPSAALQRENFLQGLKHLMSRGQFWLVAGIYGVSLGTLGTWSSVLDIILKGHHIDKTEAGWIGFYSTISGCFASLIVARFADFFSRKLKWFVLSLYIVGTSAFVIFALTTSGILPPHAAVFYATIIVGTTALNAAVPLIFELTCELAHPIGEGTANGILTIGNNLFGFIFLLIPGVGNEWTNWTLVGTSGICIPLLFALKERYNRLKIDELNPSLSAEIVYDVPSV